MGSRKKDNDMSGKITFSKRQIDAFKKADALARQARIRMDQAKLKQIEEQLAINKAYGEDLRKRREENPLARNYNGKEIPELKPEDLLVIRKQLEDLKKEVERKRVDMEASLALLELSKSDDNKN